jgi:hypothetical protein
MLVRTALAIAATSALLSAQYDYDKVTSGRLGNPLDMAVRNAPANQLILYLVSTNAGPTPLALLDPTDPRSLQVGTDLLGLLTFGLTSPTGTGGNSISLPVNPALSGALLH